jgi:peptidyl-prolyl cis-trans isomerase SurA
MIQWRYLPFYLVLFIFTVTPLSARELLESIAAIVDGKPIMRSEVMGNLYQFKNTPEAKSMSESEQMKFVLDQLIDEKVLLSRISRDSIVVSDEEVDQRVSMHLNNLAASQNTDLATLEKAIRMQLGISMAQYRDQLSKQIRDHIYVARIRQIHVGPMAPTKKEVVAFYTEYKDSLPLQYNCISVSHLQLNIEPSQSILDSVKKEAMRLIDSLDRGMNWEILAKRYSQDASAAKGGDIGFARKGTLDPDYERSMERLKNGQYADQPVKTPLGYHIIKVLGRKEDGVRSAHILLRTIPSSQDSLKIINQIEAMREGIKTKEAFAEKAKQYSQDKQTSFKGGDLGWFQRTEFDSNYVQTISRLSVGEISEPVLIENAYHLFRLDDERQERSLTLEEDYPKIEALAANQMETKKLESLVKKWRQEVHIEIRLKE